MSTRCNVKVTQNGRVDYLYHHMDGDLAYIGAMVALAGRKAQEGEIEDPTLWLLNSQTWNFQPTTETHGDIEYFYHIDLLPSGNVIIGYCNRNMGYSPNFNWTVLEDVTKRFKVKTFIKKVNRARLDTGLRKLRLPRTNGRDSQPEPETQYAPRGYTQEERLEIANTILLQMGGSGRLSAMIGMTNPMISTSPYNDNLTGLKFNFKGSRKANICQVTYLTGSDTYLFELYKFTPVRYSHCPLVYSADGVYFDQLIELFETNTGLYLHL